VVLQVLPNREWGRNPLSWRSTGELAASKVTRERAWDSCAEDLYHAPPDHLRQTIAEERQVYTLAEPPKFFGKGALRGKQLDGGAAPDTSAPVRAGCFTV
jgi:hypothetical protein